MMDVSATASNLSQKIAELLEQARSKVVQAVNFTMVYTYFEIGRMIVEEEQNGIQRAKYGSLILPQLSRELTEKFGKGFSVTNLKQMRQFYLVYQKGQTVSDQLEFRLSWSHYVKLLQIDDPLERRFYEIEAVKNNAIM